MSLSSPARKYKSDLWLHERGVIHVTQAGFFRLLSRISWLRRWLKKRRTQKLQRRCAHCYLKDESEAKHGAELCDNCKLRNWLSNYRLNDVDSFSLFNEFLEMGMCPDDRNSRHKTNTGLLLSNYIFFSLLSPQWSSSALPPYLWQHFLLLLCWPSLIMSLRYA